MARDTFDYRKKSVELEDIVAKLENPNIEVDEAVRLHANGLKLITELETYLGQAQNEIKNHLAE